MRRLKYGPLFSHVYGMKPWEIGRLTVAEFDRYQQWADEWVKAQQKQQKV